MKEKKELFKLLIKEFHGSKLPSAVRRELNLLLPARANKAITIFGTRRCGKTFYFYQLIHDLRKKTPAQRIVYLNFEDERILPLKAKELGELLEAYFELYPEEKNHQLYFFFDEIQNITDWEIFIRRILDKEKIKVFITGSSAKLLSREIATSLRGRTLSYQLFPLNFREFLKFKGIDIPPDFAYTDLRFNIKKLLNEFINWGGFPEVAMEEKLKPEILKEYYETILTRDLAERYEIRNISLLNDLLKFLLTNISSPFSLNSYFNLVKQSVQASKETLSEYLSHIQETGIIKLIPIHSYSLKVQQVNPKKIYSVDNGLRNAVAFKFSSDEGRLVENIVFQELQRRNYEIFYWKNKGEVDFIAEKRGVRLALDVTYAPIIDKKDIKNLLEFSKYSKKNEKLFLLTRDIEKEFDQIQCLPLWKWLLLS